MWQVNLTKHPHIFPWLPDYFPRKFHYKVDAMKFAQDVATYGGEAEVKKVMKNA